MQLTPRTLTMALGACLAGGLVLGVAAAFGPALSGSSASPERAPSSLALSPAELGDVQVSFPSPTTNSSPTLGAPAAAPSRSAGWPASAVASPSKPDHEDAVSSPPADASATPSPTATPRGPRPTVVPAPAPTQSSTPRPTGTTPSLGNPIAPGQRPAHANVVNRSTPRPLGGWHGPRLGLGVTDIGAPRLSSAQRADVTVMCTPSTACSVSGSSLTITPAASSVSVTWSTPAGRKWHSWAVTRAYGAPHAG